MKELSVVEICAGAGGQSLGLHLAGFNHLLAVELDSDAATTLERNLKRLTGTSAVAAPLVAVGDVADETVWKPEDYAGVDLLAGGVPCPPFSIAGSQKGAQDERDLFAWAVEAAGRMNPKAVLLENVRGLSMPRFSGYRQAVLDRFAELGYAAEWRLIEARDYGVPQLRPRFILVALKQELFPFFAWPSPAPQPLTVGSVLLDLMSENGWKGAKAWSARANRIAPTIVGGSKKHGGPDLGPTRAKREWLAMGVDGLGIADAAPDALAPADFIPKLTNAMIARLQGWMGADYAWDFGPPKKRKTAIYRQIGNAFPPPVARAIGTAIARALRQEASASNSLSIDDAAKHDEVYSVMRGNGGFMSIEDVKNALAGRLDEAAIAKRIKFLGKDFQIDELSGAQQAPLYRLGTWRAFRGQEDHVRHASFVTSRDRARIS